MATMQAPTNGTAPSSLLELGARYVAKTAAKSKANRQRRPRRGFFAVIGRVLGTFAALACFAVAAFTVGFVVGMAVSGVALLLLDYKIGVERHRVCEAMRR